MVFSIPSNSDIEDMWNRCKQVPKIQVSPKSIYSKLDVSDDELLFGRKKWFMCEWNYELRLNNEW